MYLLKGYAQKSNSLGLAVNIEQILLTSESMRIFNYNIFSNR